MSFTQSLQRAPSETVPSMGAPQLQHSIVAVVWAPKGLEGKETEESISIAMISRYEVDWRLKAEMKVELGLVRNIEQCCVRLPEQNKSYRRA